MEPKRRLVYVDCLHKYQAGEALSIREPDWFPRLRPILKKIYREDTHEQTSRVYENRSNIR